MDDLELLGKVADRESGKDKENGVVELPKAGSLIGKLRIESVIGHGGIGVVYKARDPETEKVRAVKIPYPKTSRRDIDRFRLEAKICANLDHPNIIKIYNVDLYAGVLPYAEMDFIDGGSMADHIKEKPLPVPVALGVIILLCRALEYAYTRVLTIDGKQYDRLLHRDIKPGNILISGNGAVKLTDFGLAKFEGIELHTITGAMPGTVPYMAPEQHQSPIASMRTDIFSLGVTLYEMVSGKRPFPEKGEDAFAQHIAAKFDGKFSPLKSIDGSVSDVVDNIVKRCLSPDPEKRYASYASLRMALEPVLGDYSDLDAEDLARLYFANRKNYRLAVSSHPRRKVRLNKRLGITAAVFLIAVSAFAVLVTISKLNEADILQKTLFHKPSETGRMTSNPVTPPPTASLTEHGGKKSISETASQKPENRTLQQRTTVSRSMAGRTPVSDKPAEISRISISSPLKEGVSAWKAGRYTEAAAILRRIPADSLLAVQRDSLVIMVLDSYYRAGAINEALLYGSENPVNDASYHLLMALMYRDAGIRREAEASFSKSVSAPCRFDPAVASKRYLYRAKYYKKIYEEEKGQKQRETMIQAWRDFIRYGCANQNTPDCDDARRIAGSVDEK